MSEGIAVFVIWIFLLLQGHVQATRIQPRHTLYTEIFAKPGDEVLLPCELANVTGIIRWLCNEKELHLDTEERAQRYHLGINQTSRHHFLRIVGVLVADDGTWHCQEVRQHHSWVHTSKPISLIVLVPPSQPHLLFEDKRLPEDATFTVREKSSVTFQCVVDNVNPAPDTIEWYLDDLNVTATSQFTSEFSVQDRLYNARSTLTLEVSRKDHRKSFACHVYHLAREGSVVTRIVFNILYTPSFIISRVPDFGYPIHEGINISLKCDVNANPPSLPHWIKDEADKPVSQSEDGYLNITSIHRDYAGWYRCSTHHKFGDFASFGYFLNVRYEPEIVQQPPPQVQVGLGGSVLLECSADGKPPPSYCWARVKGGGQLESLGMEQNLLLDRILYTDAGVYKCIARNNIGWEEKRADSHNVEVVVTGKPLVAPINRTLLAMVGHPVSFSVHYCANPEPKRAQWITKNFVLNPGDTIGRFVAHNITRSDASNCYEATLDITEVHSEDSGEFLFIVKNSKGIDDGVILLNITQASFSISAATAVVKIQGCIWLYLILHILLVYIQ